MDQTLGVVFFLMALSAFYGIFAPALAPHSTPWAAATALHTCATGFAIACWLYLVWGNHGAQSSMEPISPSNSVPNPYCDYCDAWYACQRRRHCFQCARCVAGYDHHCSYLNCCINDETYFVFVCLIGTVLAMEALG